MTNFNIENLRAKLGALEDFFKEMCDNEMAFDNDDLRHVDAEYKKTKKMIDQLSSQTEKEQEQLEYMKTVIKIREKCFMGTSANSVFCLSPHLLSFFVEKQRRLKKYVDA